MLCHFHAERDAHYWVRAPAEEVIWPVCLGCTETLLDMGAREDAFIPLAYKDDPDHWKNFIPPAP